MHILHVIAGIDESGGGMSEVVPRLCEELVVQGHDVQILTLGWTRPSAATLRAEAAGVKVKYCTPSRCFPFPLSIAYSVDFAECVDRYVCDADVIHLHGLWQWPCWKAARTAIKRHKPFVMQTHGFLEPARLARSKIRKKVMGCLIERRMLSATCRIIATAESEKESILKYGVKKPVEIVPIGMDVTEIDAGQRDEELLWRLGVPVGKKVVLFLSRLAPIKGLDLLADAWMRLKEFHDAWHLLIVGDDTQGYSKVVKQDYARIVTDGSATLPGPVYGRDKFNLLKSVEGFVLPTRSENFGIAVQEALAAGMPVVCTKGAPWGKIQDVGAGWWVDISVDGIERGLRNMMSLSVGQRSNMGFCGRKFVIDDFGWKTIVTKQVSIYKQINHELNEV